MKKQLTSDAFALDVNKLSRRGGLVPGARTSINWNLSSGAALAIRVEGHEETLDLRIAPSGKGGHCPIFQHVELARVPCHFGGARAYLVFPSCADRDSILDGLAQRFPCRRCKDLLYPSQVETGWDRALRRRDRLKGRLGCPPILDAFLAERPRGMWRRTFERLVEEAENAEAVANHYFQSKISKRARR